MMKLSNSYFRRQIEHHFDEMDLDVVVRKHRHAYALYWEDDDEPLAKLRPTGTNDEVEVYCWENDHWERVKEIDVVQPLDEALKYITDDPADRFFDNKPEEDNDPTENNGSDEDDASEIAESSTLREVARSGHLNLMACSITGAAFGGIFSDLWWGIFASSTVAMIVCSIPDIISFRRPSIFDVAMCLVVTPFACVGGVTGSAVNAGLGSGHWSIVCGMLIGVSCSWMLFRGGVLAWSAGFLAGLNFAIALLEIWHIENLFGHLFLVAFIASIGASLCHSVMSGIVRTARRIHGC